MRVTEAIRASHIKPWSASTDEERMDPFNGLPLVATLDAIFDVGLISFRDDGGMLLSEHLDASDVRLLDLEDVKLRVEPPARTAAYLAYHRNTVFGRRPKPSPPRKS